ncbi:MAG: CBS domain-containing protein, partial [Candidatus Diapherotrites archaeon]
SLVPSYDKAKRLIDFLDSMQEQTRLKASEIMCQKVFSILPEKTVREAVKMMKKNAVSQLPVIKNGMAVGTVSEKAILEELHSEEEARDLGKLRVEEIMQDAMPVIQENAPFDLISSMLEYSPGVLVGKKGKIQGIITKADLLNVMLSKGPKRAKSPFFGQKQKL